MSSQNSGGSARSPRQRNKTSPSQHLSTIEKSVTQLLIATKQLLETLTAWSRQQATEAEVSDVYVRLGSEFNLACRAFTAIGVETADLGNVPDALRTILESTLSQDASPQSLDVYLPRIREIIINLLHGLKRKQQKLRQKNTRESGGSSGGPPSEGGLPSQPAPPPRARSGDSLEEVAPPRSSSLPSGGQNQRGSSPTPPYPTSARGSTSSARNSHNHNASISSNLASPPITNDSADVYNKPAINEAPVSMPDLLAQTFVPPPPPPTPPAQDALAALQREDPLQRRASRRYSAYQIAKLTGSSPGGVPMLPSNPSVVPRNRESKESLDAVRVRRSYQPKSVRSGETSPMRNVNRISEEREADPSSSVVKEIEREAPAVPAKDNEVAKVKPTIKVDTGTSPPTPQKGEMKAMSPTKTISSGVQTSSKGPDSRRDSSPPLGKDLTLFLQLGRSIKKVYLADGLDELSITSLRLLFISKFNYNPPSGEDFPEIYLQDPVSGVRYELEDTRDVKDRAVLCLNIEVLDEVKRHIDDGMGNLRKLVEGLRGSVDGQGLQIQRVAERQEDAAKKIAELSVAPPVTTPILLPQPQSPPSPPSASSTKQDNAAQLGEIRDLRKDLAVLRQVYSTFVADINTSMSAIKTKASSVKAVASNPALGPNEGRAYVEAGKKALANDADALVNRVDDLQDTVEDLRKDVVQRGVRPLARNLNQVKKEIAQARAELKKMAEYIKKEKPVFRKVWEKEVELVCQEQDFFNMQENLIEDLQDDLDKAGQTFQLVEQCTETQFKANGVGGSMRSASRGFPMGMVHPDDQLDPTEAKDSVLSEVRALQPNHEGRLEAIEKAEKARQKELEGRVPEFQKELGEFVEEGKLKKAGGVDEVERLRMVRDEKIRKDMWELKKQMEEAEARAEAEESDDEEESSDEDDDATNGGGGA
ncbi:actin interacting protein 3-domain-containing protein [Tuber borchii]|uniref:Actin interacting protein 3-domain-containing protein n=1 Tax=Tuber borchii TaxID=42251 RepID=A0A2T6ZW77_TUBBO|nr:actin interacting protein 3-domain-containing protein [Tuber borchii]